MTTASAAQVSGRDSRASHACPTCGHVLETFFELPGVPVNSCILVDTYEDALAFPRGDVVLGFCVGCGFILNTAFRAELAEYNGRYEETQAYSGTFSRFHKALAHELVERLDLRNKRVIEIGCGKGEFLALLCELGGNRGLGYDPGFDARRPIFAEGVDAKVVAGFFGEGSGTGDGDFVCCKMTLEHIPSTARFVGAAREAMRPSPESVMFFQVPEAMRIFRDCAFEDIYYEHCSYFTPGSLARLFRSQGFQPLRLEITYGGQYLTIEARLAQGTVTLPLDNEDAVGQLAACVADFSERFHTSVARWRSLVLARAQEGPVVIWGSGSKAVAFLRAIDLPGVIEHVVDINPYRQGHYMPGTGQQILGPDALSRIAPRTVIAMNSIYLGEIGVELGQTGVDAELLGL